MSDFVEIPLPGGLSALVSKCDEGLVRQHAWCKQAIKCNNKGFYAKAHLRLGNGKSRKLYMHRLVLGLDFGDGRRVDHINGNGLDNRRENLRLATPMLNSGNARRKSKTTGFKGVYKDKKKFVAGCGGTRSGPFDTAIEAAREYDAMALRRYGEFALTNAAMGLIP
jgi:hypothetical protein